MGKESMAAERVLKRRNVGFSCADIVEFEPTGHTTTITSGDVPIGMSFKERRRVRRRLDSFEEEREEVRVGRQEFMEGGYIEPEERKVILGKAGLEPTSISAIVTEVNRVIKQRIESNESDQSYIFGLGECMLDIFEQEELSVEPSICLKPSNGRDTIVTI